MDEITVFISYTRDDERIALGLETLFNSALGPAVHVFRDETRISSGADIRDAILKGLQKADVLIALNAGGQPASALSWVGWEIGTFEALCRSREEAKDPRVHPPEDSVVGRVVVLYNAETLCNGETSLGPQSGRKAVGLGIPIIQMSEPATDEDWERFHGDARSHTELQRLVQTMERLVKDGKHKEWFQRRQQGIDTLVIDFKEIAFQALKGRVKDVTKPTKQLLVRFGLAVHQDVDTGLPGAATLTFCGRTTGIFGLQQNHPNLSRTVDEHGVERYATTWDKFKDAVKPHRYGAYWQHVIEQVALGAKKGGDTFDALDANLVLVADNKKPHRVVATTVTTFFNNECEVSLYLIEPLQRRPRFARPSFAIHIKVDQLAILQDGEIPPEADVSGEGGWELIFGQPVGTESCKWREVVSRLESPEPWIYQLAILMWRAYDLRVVQYPSVGARIKFGDQHTADEYRVFRLCLQDVDVIGDTASFAFAAAAVVVPYEPAKKPKETRLYHLYNLAWFFRQRLLERELSKLDTQLLNKPRNKPELVKIIREIENDFRTMLADAQVRGMEQPAPVIQAFPKGSPLREQVVKRLNDDWPKLYDELLTNIKAGEPAAELISKTLHNMKPINQFFLKVSIEELKRHLGDESDQKKELEAVSAPDAKSA